LHLSGGVLVDYEPEIAVKTESILLIEDDPSGRELGLFNLKKAGYRAEAAVDGTDGIERFDPERHDLVITDVKMPGLSGLEVLKRVKDQSPDTPVIVITAYGDVELAVQAMKAGAADFIGKPFNRDHLLLSVEKGLEGSRLRREVRELRIRASGVERPIVYRSALMGKLLETADRVAASEATVLLRGESGTGKELVARRIHVRSGRASGPFVELNCAAVPAELLESELFGHEKGAFTGAVRSREGKFRRAAGGTIFLDELAELPLPLQSKLLRVLQERVVDVVGGDSPVEVDVRVIAATNQDLSQRINDGQFREDLYYRLNVVELILPPLRQRLEDVEPLLEHFVARLAEGRELTAPASLVEQLRGRPWRGNVRELRNVCERLVILAQSDELSADDLPITASGRGASDDPLDGWPPLPPAGLSLIELERRVIERVLALQSGNVSQAARYLGVPRHILTYRMEKYGIRRPGS
jgi:two-component system, NtrC family, response regulator